MNEEHIKAMLTYVAGFSISSKDCTLDEIAEAEQKLAEEMGKTYEGRMNHFLDQQNVKSVSASWFVKGGSAITAKADKEPAARLAAWYAAFTWWQKIKE